jgi:hypothetical protein
MTPRGPRVRLAAGAAVLAAAVGVLLGGEGAAQEPPVPLPPTPVPERGVAVVLEPVSGRVLVGQDDEEDLRPLQAAERLPVGTTVDAKHGEVRVTVARNRRGDTWSAVFSDGGFIVRQPATGTPVTTLKLTGPRLRDVCRRVRATASAGRKKSVRKLWGDGRGRFRTKGRYSAATVRGTRWLTADRCDGTVTRVVRGAVAVEDFTDEREPPDDGGGPRPAPGAGGGEAGVIVSAGDSHVARPGR